MASWQEDPRWGFAAAVPIVAAVSWALARHTSTSAANANRSGGPASPRTTGSAENGDTSGTHTVSVTTATGLFTRTPSPAAQSARARIATRAEAARSSHEFLTGCAAAIATEGGGLMEAGIEGSAVALFDVAGALIVIADGLQDVAE
jgi:hypothetical protein